MKERRENVRTEKIEKEKIEKEKIEKEKIEKEGTEYLEELELLEKEFKQRTLDMKIKYGEIPVPEAARDRILSGIHQAKAEKERILSFQDIQRQAEASKQIKKEASADKKQAGNNDWKRAEKRHQERTEQYETIWDF